MPSHTLMVRFASEAAAQSFEQWLQRGGYGSTSRACGDVTVELCSSTALTTVQSEAERCGGLVAWDEDDSADESATF